MKRSLSLLAFVALLLASAPASRAIGTNTSISFSGVCSDCSGNGTGTLVVTGFVPGNVLTLSLSNFVSFSYDGTNLLAPFVITSPSFVSGSIGPGFPAPYDVTIASGNLTFTSSTNGSWSISNEVGTADFGATSNYSLATAGVPEPTTFALLGGSLGLLFAWRRPRP